MSSSITTTLILKAAEARGWKTSLINEQHELYCLTLPDGRYYYLRNNRSRKNYSINAYISGKKDLVYQIAEMLQVRIPATEDYASMDQATSFLEKFQNIVVKPADNSHGNGVTVGVTSVKILQEALEHALSYSTHIILQENIAGDDYRLLMINQKLAGAVVRKPAFVVGDGKSSILQLIELENRNPLRGNGYENELTFINVEEAKRYVGDQISSIPAADEEVRVMGVANIGMGGVSVDVTDEISAEMVEAATKIVTHFDMGLAGVDFMMSAEGVPYLLEINSMPSFGLHEYPYQGISRKPAEKFLDWLST